MTPTLRGTGNLTVLPAVLDLSDISSPIIAGAVQSFTVTLKDPYGPATELERSTTWMPARDPS